MPYIPGSISIGSPANGSAVVVGQTFRVQGSTSPRIFFKPDHSVETEIPPSSVTCAGQGATALGADWAGWYVDVRLTTPGAHSISATAKWSGDTQDDSITVTAVATPLNLVQPGAPVSTVEFGVGVQASHPNGIASASARVDGQGWVGLQNDGSTWRGRLQLSSNVVPPGGRDATVDLQATSGDGLVHQRSVTIRAVDAVVPAVLSFEPGDGAKIVGTNVGATATVVARASDPAQGQLTSGIAAVEVQLDNGPWTPMSHAGGDGYAASVFIPGADDHRVSVRARDAQGQTSNVVSHRVVVTAPAELRDVSRQSYLLDLLDFTTQRLVSRTLDGGSIPPLVNVRQLSAAVGQDLAQVAHASPFEAETPVRTLRLVIEALGRYMRSAPAPLAEWPLHEGEGTIAHDAAGGLADATIENATWVAGETPVLHFDPGSAARVRIPAPAATQVRVRNRMTMVARVRPSADTTEPGAILSKDGEYEFVRLPDGRLHFALATAAPGWNWVDTGVKLELGTWSQVAIAYDGATVRTWIDGTLCHTANANGDIGDAAPGADELTIGARPSATLFFAGDIADVAVYDRALSAYEIHRLLGRSDDAGGTRSWIDDDLPADAQTSADSDAWQWTSDDPVPAHAGSCHVSQVSAGLHQHYMRMASTAFTVDAGDTLVCDVWLDPVATPRTVMLQFLDADDAWEHRAYWGENLIEWGADGTVSRRSFGALPATGRWVTLRVPAAAVGLEHRTVHGLAFTLFDGRAAWDRSGRVTAQSAADASSGHLVAAYDALLRANGTSETELRLARGATTAARNALAERLGITLSTARPDETLDTLLLDAPELTAQALADHHGFADPLGGVHAPVRPLLTQLRLATLRQRWRDADHGAATPVSKPAVIDPEVVRAEDLADATGAAAGLLQERLAWRQTQLDALDALRKGAADDDAAVTAVITQVLGGVDLDEIAGSRRAGNDVTVQLTAAGLDLPGFARLLQLRDLARTGPILEREWDDAVAILVRVLRRRNQPAWRDAERTADVVVDPAVFRMSAAPLPGWMDVSAHQDWLDRLVARATAVDSVAAIEAAALAAADDAALPLLRDALIATLDPGLPGLSAADALTSRLFVDVGAGAQDVTSRVGQAIEAVQGLVFAARTNQLIPQDPWPPPGPAAAWQLRETQEYPRADFDAEWRWMGTYATWQAAVSVFFRPELMLLPSLRPALSDNFTTLVDALADEGADLSPVTARKKASEYWDGLADKAGLDTIRRLVLTDQLTRADIAQLAAEQRQRLAGTATLEEIPQTLLEVFWLIPLQIALSLERAGQQAAAADWLRTVYAYDATGADRIVFYGFTIHAGAGGGIIARPLNWMLGDELNPHRLAQDRGGAHLRFALLLLARTLVEGADNDFTADTTESRPRARGRYLAARRALRMPEFDDAPGGPRIPVNPLLDILRGRVEANLAKLRRGLTIAGVPRAAPIAASATQLVLPSADGGALVPPQPPPLPTPYRYATLIVRAQQLLASAAQVEASYLSALAGADSESYTEQKASDDLELAAQRVTIQQASVTQAGLEVTVASAQVTRAAEQLATLDGWIAGGPTDWETKLLASYQEIAGLKTLVAFADTAITTFTAAASASTTGAPAAAMVALAAGGRYIAQGSLAAAEARSQEAASQASYERRLQEWQLQQTLARDDKAIADAQFTVAQGRQGIAVLEQTLAETEQAHAASAVAYLAGRRLTGEMYGWMAGQLGDVYRYLLRQATSLAQLAQNQLAFERQQAPPAVIRANYWTAPGEGQATTTVDRRGLTGSARLLRDLTELDQHAFETNRRQLNLEHSFALSRTAPDAFADFRRTGVLGFATAMDAFDRRFPGHLLRTIRRVRVAVVALIPPAQGIAATLTCSGQSRVAVTSPTGFETITLARPPETVAYTSPASSTGIFELDPQPELKFWFEGHGVDTTWEFRLPRAANPIDYRGIADVLVTLEYTALLDADYERQVKAALPSRMSGTLALSISDDFPDAWYALLNPDPDHPGEVAPVTLPVTPADFPRNLDDVRLDAVAVLFVRAGERAGDAEFAVEHLHLVRGDRRVEGGAAVATRDVISTRLGAADWLELLDPTPEDWDKAPTGDWELALSSDPETREPLRAGAIADIVLVLSYHGTTPGW